MNETYVERRKRGFFGWIFLLIFIAWNLLMLFAFVKGMSAVSDTAGMSAAEKAGHDVGAGIGAIVILVVWALGSVITGLLALLTRGSKTIVKRQG